MAGYSFKFFMIFLWVTTTSTAPHQDISGILKIPEECKGQTFCSVKPVGYDEIEKKITSILPKFLSNEEKYVDRDGNPDLEDRLSPESEWDNCPKRFKREQVYLRINENSEADIIVQVAGFQQFIETVTCARDKISNSTRAECFKDLGAGTFNTISSCKETFAKRTLYVYQDSNIIQKNYEVPACCKCMVSYDV